jgi:hypothetical protein
MATKRPVWLSVLKWIGIIALGQVVGGVVALITGVESYATVAGWVFFLTMIGVHRKNQRAAKNAVTATPTAPAADDVAA